MFLAKNVALNSNIIFIFTYHIQIFVSRKFLFLKNKTEISQYLTRKPQEIKQLLAKKFIVKFNCQLDYFLGIFYIYIHAKCYLNTVKWLIVRHKLLKYRQVVNSKTQVNSMMAQIYAF